MSIDLHKFFLKFRFPSISVLGLGQMVSTVVVLWIAKRLNYITFPNLQRDTVKKIWPLPVIYAGQSSLYLQSFNQLLLDQTFIFSKSNRKHDDWFGWDSAIEVSLIIIFELCT